MPYESPESNLLKINGQFGATFVTGSGIYTGTYFCVQAFSNCTFNMLAASNIDNISAFNSGAITLPQGVAIFGNFTGVQLNAGQAFLYKH